MLFAFPVFLISWVPGIFLKENAPPDILEQPPHKKHKKPPSEGMATEKNIYKSFVRQHTFTAGWTSGLPAPEGWRNKMDLHQEKRSLCKSGCPFSQSGPDGKAPSFQKNFRTDFLFRHFFENAFSLRLIFNINHSFKNMLQ